MKEQPLTQQPIFRLMHNYTYIRHLFGPILNLFHTLHINGIRRSHRQEW